MAEKIFVIFTLLFSFVYGGAIDSVYKYKDEISKYFSKELSYWDMNRSFNFFDQYRDTIITISKSKWHEWNLDKKNSDINYYKKMEDSIINLLANKNLCKKYNFDTTSIYMNLIMQYILEEKIEFNFMRRFSNDILKQNSKEIENFLNNYVNNSKDYARRVWSPGVLEIASLAGIDLYQYIFITRYELDRTKEKYKLDSIDGIKTGMSLTFLFSRNDSDELIAYICDTLLKIPEHIFYKKHKKYDKNKLLKMPIEELQRERLRFIEDKDIISIVAKNINYIPEGKKHSVYFSRIHELLESLYSDYNISVDLSPSLGVGYYWFKMHYEPEKHNGISAEDMFAKNYMDFMEKYEKWLMQKFGKKLAKKPTASDIELDPKPWR